VDWQTPVAAGIALLSASYALWYWLKPVRSAPTPKRSQEDCSAERGEALLQIEDA